MENEFKEFTEESIPTLSFDVVEEVEAAEVRVEEEAVKKSTELAEAQLTPAEKQMVMEFVDKIDLNNTNAVLQYGAATQKKMADFSSKALEIIKT